MTIKLTSSALTKNLVKRNKLIQHIEQGLNDWDGPLNFEYGQKAGDDAWHPSGDCTPPVAALFAKACAHLDPDQDGRESISPSLRKTFLVGHFWHAFLQQILLDSGLAMDFTIERRGIKGWGEEDRDNPFDHIDRKTLWQPFSWATGSADVAPCQVPGYGDCIVDFKTMNSRDFSRNFPPEWAAPKWEAQLNVYMDWFDQEKALIVGINKDSPHDLKEFEYRRNQPLIDAIYQKWSYVGYFLDNPEIPNADDDIELPFQGVHE